MASQEGCWRNICSRQLTGVSKGIWLVGRSFAVEACCTISHLPIFPEEHYQVVALGSISALITLECRHVGKAVSQTQFMPLLRGIG